MTLHFLHRASVALVFLVGARAADAACVISGARPVVPPPAAGQQFSFIATADCEKLRFRVPGSTFVAIPKAGPDRGTKDRTYKVVLTEREWNSLVDEGDTTFTWSIIGTTSAGVTTRVTTTTELKVEGGDAIDLSMADAKLVGEEPGDIAGAFPASAGDVDGDGHDDLLVGSGNDEGGSGAGAAYLVLGPVTGTFDLSLADAKLVGEEAGNYASQAGPRASSSAGDVDGDGFDDLLIGALGYEGGVGAAYVVHGPVTGTLDLSLADSKLWNSDLWLVGWAVAGVGDVDADGRDDVLVLDEYEDAWLVLAPATGTIDLSLADATLVGEDAGAAPMTASGAGDVDADGHDDLLLGAYVNDEGGDDAGAAYLVLGPVTGTFDLSGADAKLVGEEPVDLAGCDVAGAGDVDNDGHDDLLVGAQYNGEGGLSAGAAYVVLGPVTGTRDLALADAKLVGGRGDMAGVYVAGAGDVNGDGHDDLLVGSWFETNAGAGELVLGPVTGTFDLSRADATLVGEQAGDNAAVVSGAGDVDADGRGDILVGAGWNDEGGADAGAAYLIYGGGLF